MKLDQYIAELLEEHDCVIVPEFGGFVANYAPAKINAVNNRFDPPHRNISFNKFLVHNDGLLAAYVARKENEAYEAALHDIRNYSLYLRSELRTQKRVSIEKVGIVFMQADGTFRFEQVKNPDFFREGFGLDSFFGKAIERKAGLYSVIEPKSESPGIHSKSFEDSKTRANESASQSAIEVEGPKGMTAERVITMKPSESGSGVAPRSKKSYLPAAAAILGIPLISYALWIAMGTPLFKDRSEFHASDLNPFTEKVCTTYNVRDAIYVPEELKQDESFVVVESEHFIELKRLDARDKTLVVNLLNKHKKEASTTETALRYHIIGGCFSVEDNAHRLVATFKERGSNASIVDKKGSLTRVSSASFATRKEAKAALDSLRNEARGAWILYK